MQIDSVIDRLRALPEEKQEEVVDFIEFLEKRNARRTPRRGSRPSREPAPAAPSRTVEIDEKEIARRKRWWKRHQKLEPIDIRPLTTQQIVREDRDSH